MRTDLDLWDLHHHSVADWERILAGHPGLVARWLRFAAERGFRSAQLVLGQMLLDGRGLARDPAAAHGWFVRAAAIGSLDARNMVGRCHEYGWGVPVDHAAALAHYRRAADGGHAWARYNVGCLLLYGEVRRDHAEAFRCFASVAASADAAAAAKAFGMLGRCHEEGWGTPPDREAALARYSEAAERGDCWGALNLGLVALEAGDAAGAAAAFERAAALATPNCRDAVARTLAGRTEPALADLRARLEADASLSDTAPTAPGTNRPSLARPVLAWTLAAALLAGCLLRRSRPGMHAR
jgi:uncharacterized protein